MPVMNKIVNSRNIAETKFINLVEDRYLDSNGIERTWVKAQRPKGQHAAVIVATVKGRIIVTREYRVPLRGYEWGFPAGLIDQNETPTQTAVRELKEETGYKVSKILGVSPLIYNSPGLTDEGAYMVYVEAEEDGEANLQDSEDISTYSMCQESVRFLLSDQSNLFGAKAWIILKQFAKYGEVLV
jgi:ADP-ribose pyrophosphatase